LISVQLRLIEDAEATKRSLAQQSGFEPRELYELIRDKSGQIRSLDLEKFLLETEITSCSEADCFMLIKHFDRDQNGSFSLSEFIKFTSPFTELLKPAYQVDEKRP
jgi:Ca2+-binding EF-hand superfamily protein